MLILGVKRSIYAFIRYVWLTEGHPQTRPGDDFMHVYTQPINADPNVKFHPVVPNMPGFSDTKEQMPVSIFVLVSLKYPCMILLTMYAWFGRLLTLWR